VPGSVTLRISKETRDKLMVDCVSEFIRHNDIGIKQMRGIKLSADYILKRVCAYYLDEPEPPT
jgi:hypothetical protein